MPYLCSHLSFVIEQQAQLSHNGMPLRMQQATRERRNASQLNLAAAGAQTLGKYPETQQILQGMPTRYLFVHP